MIALLKYYFDDTQSVGTCMSVQDILLFKTETAAKQYIKEKYKKSTWSENWLGRPYIIIPNTSEKNKRCYWEFQMYEREILK